MKNTNNKSSIRTTVADDVFEGLDTGDTKGIFARIPSRLHDDVLSIKDETGKSIYDIVERALKLFVAEYKVRKGKDS